METPQTAQEWAVIITRKPWVRDQVGQGRLCGRGQSPAKPGRHLRLPVRLAALRARGAALAPRRGGAAAAAAPGGAPLEGEPVPRVPAPPAPLVPRTAPRGGASAPKPRRPRRQVRAASQQPTPCQRSSWSRPASRGACSGRPPAAAARPSGWPRPLRRPGPPGAGGDRRWTCWPARSRRSSAAGRRNGRRRRGPSAGGGWSLSTAVSSAAAACRTAAAGGRRGGRALVRERCCALHNCRVRLTPWLPLV